MQASIRTSPPATPPAPTLAIIRLPKIDTAFGLTEVYGPATVCAKQDAWTALDIGERARLNVPHA